MPLLPMPLKEPAFRAFSRKPRVLRENTSLVLSGPRSTWFNGELAKATRGMDRAGTEAAALESEAVEPCLVQSRGVFLFYNGQPFFLIEYSWFTTSNAVLVSVFSEPVLYIQISTLGFE